MQCATCSRGELRGERSLPALALSDAEQLHCGESCGARAERQPWGMAGFCPHKGLGAAGLRVASQTQRPQGLELPGVVRRECAAWHAREGWREPEFGGGSKLSARFY